MNVQILIDSTVRQITVLIAQLATSGGVRSPLAHVANQVFVELAQELESQGVSRKVSADMFGMALRAYIRKVRQLSESETTHGVTLWQAVFAFIREGELVSRVSVFERFKLDARLQLNSILRDLSASGLVFSSGAGNCTMFRVATDKELGQHSRINGRSGLDEMAWALVYQEQNLSVEQLGDWLSLPKEEVLSLVERLSSAGRITKKGMVLSAPRFSLPLGSETGWEAGVFDHLQAVVQTICQRLAQMDDESLGGETVGGSTYAFDVWEGHPLFDEVQEQLSKTRAHWSDLRKRVDAFNAEGKIPKDYQRVVNYVGKCVLEQNMEA